MTMIANSIMHYSKNGVLVQYRCSWFCCVYIEMVILLTGLWNWITSIHPKGKRGVLVMHLLTLSFQHVYW